MKIIAVFLWVALGIFAQTPTPADRIDAARKGPGSAEMKQQVAAVTAATLVTVWGQDYLFLATSASPVTVSIDLQPQIPLSQVDATHWMLLTKMRTGVLHQYQFYAAGKALGARCAGGEQCGQHVAQYRPGTRMGVCRTAGVLPHVSQGRMFWLTRRQFRGPGVAGYVLRVGVVTPGSLAKRRLGGSM